MKESGYGIRSGPTEQQKKQLYKEWKNYVFWFRFLLLLVVSGFLHINASIGSEKDTGNLSKQG
jgi:hypothetical protein